MGPGGGERARGPSGRNPGDRSLDDTDDINASDSSPHDADAVRRVATSSDRKRQHGFAGDDGAAGTEGHGGAHPQAFTGLLMSWKFAGGVAFGVVAGILLARATQDAETGTASWDGLRAAGFAAYVCLWVSVCSGIAVHMRFRARPIALTWVLESHRMSSALSLSFVAGHIAGLLVDPTIAFTVLDVAAGVTSGYRPLQVSFGTVAMWGLVAVLGSTALAGRMPYAVWRNLHWLSFPAYGFALLHGVTAGTNASSMLALGLYASTASVVAALVVVRVLGRGWVDAAAAPAGSARSAN